jgi:amino acid transporter
MDTATKEQFKWKFYRLAMLLNLIVLLIAAGVIAFFIAPEDYKIPAFLILFIMAFMAGIYFRGKYRETKEWLDEQQ